MYHAAHLNHARGPWSADFATSPASAARGSQQAPAPEDSFAVAQTVSLISARLKEPMSSRSHRFTVVCTSVAKAKSLMAASRRSASARFNSALLGRRARRRSELRELRACWMSLQRIHWSTTCARAVHFEAEASGLRALSGHAGAAALISFVETWLVFSRLGLHSPQGHQKHSGNRPCAVSFRSRPRKQQLLVKCRQGAISLPAQSSAQMQIASTHWHSDSACPSAV